MKPTRTDPRIVAVWTAMAEQFLDTERRQEIPMLGLRCVEAGLTPEEARRVWVEEVTPVVGFNLELVAGEWAAWDDEWLVASIESQRQKPPGRRVNPLEGVWEATERCIRFLRAIGPAEERAQATGDLMFLAHHHFDFAARSFATLSPRDRQRVAMLFPSPFEELVAPATYAKEQDAAGRRRVQAAIRLDDLRDRLETALRAEGAQGDFSPLFEDLVRRYDEPHRHYHCLAHLHDCLATFDGFARVAERPDEVTLALWFHDAVYDPHRPDNEQASALLARDWLLRLSVRRASVDRITAWVEGTKTHDAATGDGALVNDVDLSILGASPERFDLFERQIRQEYAWAPEDAYRAGRAHVLEGFLAREHIYQVAEVRARFEAAARRNLARALEALR